MESHQQITSSVTTFVGPFLRLFILDNSYARGRRRKRACPVKSEEVVLMDNAHPLCCCCTPPNYIFIILFYVFIIQRVIGSLCSPTTASCGGQSRLRSSCRANTMRTNGRSHMLPSYRRPIWSRDLIFWWWSSWDVCLVAAAYSMEVMVGETFLLFRCSSSC